MLDTLKIFASDVMLEAEPSAEIALRRIGHAVDFNDRVRFEFFKAHRQSFGLMTRTGSLSRRLGGQFPSVFPGKLAQAGSPAPIEASVDGQRCRIEQGLGEIDLDTPSNRQSLDESLSPSGVARLQRGRQLAIG